MTERDSSYPHDVKNDDFGGILDSRYYVNIYMGWVFFGDYFLIGYRQEEKGVIY